MSSFNLLSVPILELRATSNSSSSSSSSMFGTDLQTSDSQTDYSPPLSPKEEALHFKEPLIKSFLDHTTHLDRGPATPKQSPRLLDRDWLEKSEDLGYDSEHESLPNTPTKHRLRLLTRKRIASSRFLATGTDLGIGADTSSLTRTAIASPQMQDRHQDTPPDTSCKKGADSDKMCIGLGLDVLPSDRTIGVTDNPLVICTSVSSHLSSSLATEPPPIQKSSLGTSPQKPRLQPIVIPDNMSPLESLPPLLSLTNLHYNSHYALSPGLLSGTDEDAKVEGTRNARAQTPGLYGTSTTCDIASGTVHENATGSNKPAPGLGLGLPSGLIARSGVQKTSHQRVATPLKTTKENPRYKEKLHSKEYHYPRRHLYNICESTFSLSVPPPRKLYSISYPGAILSIAQALQCAISSNNRHSSLPLVLDVECLYGSTSPLLKMMHFQKAKRDRNTSLQENPFVWSPSSLYQPYTIPARPKSTYDTVAPWANTEAFEKQKLRLRSGPYLSSTPPARNTIISPVLIHINMPKKLHFGNHRHYRTEHTLF